MRKIHTFDIFDTLIARRCITPINIFYEIERDLKMENYTQIRTLAEQNLSNIPHDLDSIYDEIVKNFGIEKSIAELLKQIEINFEITNAIPIQENIDKVHDGDILITDMYLPRRVIESILEKVGLVKQVGLIISNKGKSSGDIWPKLSTSVAMEQHLGDNIHSDVSSPLSCGILGLHVENHKLTNVESFFESNGFILLSRLIRESRLRSFTMNLTRQENEQRMLQINCNMPMLLLACMNIHNTADTHGIEQILFSSRDCYMLEKIYRVFSKTLNWQEKSCYFFTSRVSRLTASASYISYFKSLTKAKSMVVDLCGTGWSLGQLYFESDRIPLTYLVHYLSNSSIKANYEKIRSSKNYEAPIFLTDDTTLNNSNIELVNYTFSGMFLDMTCLNGYDAFIPVFEHPNYDPAVLKALKQVQLGRDIFIDTLKNYDLSSVMSEINLNMSKIPTVFVELYKFMSQELSCMSDVSKYHISQDLKSMLLLRKI